MSIKPTDIISGRQYLKLISDYREYDSRQKRLIYRLRKQIELLEWSIEDLKTEIDDLEDGSTDKLRRKIKNQRAALHLCLKKTEEQRKEIEELKSLVRMLQEENNSLRNA